MAQQQNPQQNAAAETEQDINILKKIRMDKLAELQAAGNDPFTITKYDVTAHAADLKADYEATEARLKEAANGDEEAFQASLEPLKEQIVSIAGRIMSWRDMGRANFIDVRDGSDRIQVYVRMNDIGGKEAFKEFKKWDIGDIVGVKGFVFRTKKGEISIHAQEITLLSKALLQLPEKWHGLKDQDTRYRKRYLDLIVNPEVKNTFVTRSKILREIRNYLDGIGYVEVETPVLLPLQIAAAARPFVTHHNTLDMDMFLRIETELNLKKLIVGGFERVYEVGRIFRNEGMDPSHNPEFTSIEMYQAYTDYEGMIREGEELAALNPHIVVKVPCIEDGIKAIKYFSNKGIRTNCTLVFSAGQALLAAKAGATYVSPFVGRLDDICNDGVGLVAQIVELYQTYDYKTQVLAASIRNTLHILQCAEVGADVVTCSLSAIKGLLNHPLTDIGLEKFLADYKKVNG